MSSSARSRLRPDFLQASKPAVAEFKSLHHPKPHDRQLLQRYLKYLPTLLLSSPWWLALSFIYTRIPPATLRDVPLPHSYAVLLLVVANVVFWTSSFLLLSGRRGIFVTLLVVGWLQFKLHHLSNGWPVLLGVLISFAIIELLLFLWNKRKRSHTNHARINPKAVTQT